MKSLNLPYNPRIDQLRWLAATIVFLLHFYSEWLMLGGVPLASPWFGIVTEGHTGVGLFFTLSGYLFMQIAMHQGSIAYGPFIRNRCLRIFPLFITIFLLAISISRDSFAPQDIFYLLSTNLGHAPTSATVVTGPAWCISIELLFYALFPFLARFAMERGPRYLLHLLALMLVMKVAAYTVNANSTLMFHSTFIGRFDQFLIGMLAAMLHARYRDTVARYAGWLLAGAFGLAVCNSALQASVAPLATSPKSLFWIVWSSMESTVWAVLIVAFLSIKKDLPVRLAGVLNQGGRISFSFYLLHYAVLHVLAACAGSTRLTGSVPVDAALLFVISYAVTWAVASLSYHTIEAPFLEMRRKYGTPPDSDARGKAESASLSA